MADQNMTLEMEDVLADPIESVLYRVGRGIALSQAEMDQHSIATQIAIDNTAELKEWGLNATWYHFPEVTIEISTALSMHAMVTKKDGKIQSRRFKLFSAPLNATYKNTFDYDLSGRSTIRTKIVSVPPPAGVKEES